MTQAQKKPQQEKATNLQPTLLLHNSGQMFNDNEPLHLDMRVENGNLLSIFSTHNHT